MTSVAATTVFCRTCRTSHSAHLVRAGDRLYGTTDCPHQPAAAELSDDADLFQQLRARDRDAPVRASGTTGPFPRGQLYITETCNCRCPVCYVSAEPGRGAHLPLVEILRRAKQARELGLRRVLLIGGEPTIHPELLAIIRGIRQLGIAVTLVTNGRRVGGEPGFARQLKAAGLLHLNLQFDTLEPATLRALRGDQELETKLRAIRHATDAGLPFSLTATVAKLNCAEIGPLIRWAGGLPVLPSLLLFQAMIAHGRFPAELPTVSREAMVREAIQSGAVAGATFAHLHGVFPLPPSVFSLHPDCGSILFALRRDGGLVPADRIVNIAEFYRAVRRRPEARSRCRGALTWAVEFLRQVRPGHRAEMIRTVLDLRPGRPNRRLMMVGFTSFCHPGFLDEQRIARCGNFVVAAHGLEPACGHFAAPGNFNRSAPRTSR